MNFFLTENINYNLKQEGLLVFILDIFKYIEVNKIKLIKEHRSIITKLKKKLSRLMDFLTILEEKIGEDSKITELEFHIQKCLIATPKSNYENIVNNIAKNKLNKEQKLMNKSPIDLRLIMQNENNKKNNQNNNNDENNKETDNNNNSKLKLKDNLLLNEKEEQHASKVLKLIQEYLIMNEQNVTGIFHLLDTDNDKQIDKFEFKRNLKLLLNNKVTNEEIEDTMNYIDTDKNNKISLKELTNYLQKFHKVQIKGKKQNISKQQDISDFLDLESKIDDKSLKIESIFRSFILSFHELQEKIGSNSVIKETAEKINSLEALKKGDFIGKFIKGVKDFSKKKFKLYLLKFIQEIIFSNLFKLTIKFNNEKLNRKEKIIKLNEIRSQINYFSLIDYAIVLIDKNSDYNTIEESLNLLILLLSHENLFAQIAFYQYFSDHPKQSFKFLAFIKWLLNNTLKIIGNDMESNEGKKNDYYKNKKKSFYSEIERHNNHKINLERIDNFRNFSSFRIFEKMFFLDKDKNFQIPKKIFLLIQLLCNNCFEPFQHFFRNQEYSLDMIENTSSINLVYDNATFLISLLSYENSIFYNMKTLELINQCFLTLSDYCFGPCKENQILLGSRRNLYKMINNLLKNDFNFIVKEEINQKKNLFLCHLIHFLKSLTSRETLKEVGEILIEEIEANFLIEKLIDIYVMKIKPNKERLFSGEICRHSHFLQNLYYIPRLKGINIYSNGFEDKCTSENCINGKISSNDLKIINTGFDIFIILMYLKDVFPTNLNISWFKFKFDFTQNLQLQNLNVENEIKKNQRKKMNLINNNYSSNKKNMMLNKKSTNMKKNIKNLEQNISLISLKSNMSDDSLNTTKDGKIFEINATDLNVSVNSVNSNSSHFAFINEGLFYNLKKCLCCRYKCCKKKKKQKKAYIYYDNNNINSNINEDNKSDLSNESFHNEIDINTRFFNKYREYFDDTYIFFSKNISNVEIVYRGEIVKTYFKIPFIFKFFQKESRNVVIWECQFENHQARLEELFKQIDHIKNDLIHQQNLGSFRIVFRNWSLFNKLAYLTTIIINLFLFIFIRNDDLEDCSGDYCKFISVHPTFDYHFRYKKVPLEIKIIQYIQLIFNSCALIFIIVNQYPLIYNRLEKKANELNLKYKEEKIQKYSGSILFYFLYEFLDKISSDHKYLWIKLYKTKGINLIFDLDVCFFILDFIISLLGIFITPFFNILQLLDIIRLNKSLQDIIRALSNNITQIISTLILLTILIYIYSVFEFFTLRSYFTSTDYMESSSNEVDINGYCDNIYNCFLSVLHIGITTNSGLSIIGGELSRNNKEYFKKYLIDITFYFLVMVLIFNVIFSLIIDGLTQLREKMKIRRKNIKEFCFVCGIQKYVFEIKGNGWLNHYKYEHNIFAYLYYVIELQQKEMSDCDGLEKFVKMSVEKNDFKFLPLNQALSLQEKKDENGYDDIEEENIVRDEFN